MEADAGQHLRGMDFSRRRTPLHTATRYNEYLRDYAEMTGTNYCIRRRHQIADFRNEIRWNDKHFKRRIMTPYSTLKEEAWKQFTNT